MAISQRDVGGGVGGATLGLLGAEVTRQSVEREMIGRRAGQVIVGVTAVGSAGIATANLLGLVDLPDGTSALLAGVAGGSTTWYAARSADVAPRLVIDVPEEVNLVGPLITTFSLGVVGIAATTAVGILT